MNKGTVYGIVGLVVVVIGAVVIFWLGMLHAEKDLTFRRVIPQSLARAMREDHFYADYKENTLIVTGTVISASGHEIQFQTHDSYGVICQLASDTPTPKVGSTVTLLTEAGRAVRQPHGVLLKDCTAVTL